MTLEQCLYAIMLESANECSYAVAEHVGGGDYQKFIDMMNAKAAELGCTNTHFNNCNGLPDPNHVVSARDMALISREAIKTVCSVKSWEPCVMKFRRQTNMRINSAEQSSSDDQRIQRSSKSV